MSADPSAPKRHRSPNYPAVGLRDAVERLRNLYAKDGKAGAPAHLAAVHIGFGKAHGQAMSVLAALKKFGLIADSGGRFAPTQRGLEIVNLPVGDPRREKALQEAVMEPSIYRELIEQHRETGWPSDDVLASELVTYKEFNPKAVDGFVKDLRDSLEFSGLSEPATLESEVEDSIQMQDAVQVRLGDAPKPAAGMPGPKIIKEILTQRVSPDCTAQVVFDGTVTQKAVEKLIAYLELAKDNYPEAQ
jgi:hypothetical protein